MRKLTEILNILTSKRLKKVEVLNDAITGSNQNQYKKLYQGIRNGKIRTDKEAADLLYGLTPDANKYQKLKSRFRQKALNNLFFLDDESNTTTTYNKAYYQCTKNVALARILVTNGARYTAVKIAESTLSKAMKYKFTDFALESAIILRQHSALLGRSKDHIKYVNLVDELIEEHKAELKAEEYYQSLSIQYAKSVSVKLELAELAKFYLDDLKESFEKYSSYMLRYNYYRIWNAYYQILGNHEKVIEICDLADNYLDANPDYSFSIRRAELSLIKMNSYMHLRDYHSGHETATNARQYFRAGSANWLRFLESHFLLAMHSDEFDQAHAIFNEAIEHPGFKKIPENRMDKWKIFNAYLYYIKRGWESNRSEFSKNPMLDPERFMNAKLSTSTDKRGYNVMILIIQIVLLLAKKDFNVIFSKAESLATYKGRYLKKDEDFRSNCFIKMLLVMEKKGFGYSATQAGTANLYDKLCSSEIDHEGAISSLEVIPFERLWEFILADLKSYAKEGLVNP